MTAGKVERRNLIVALDVETAGEARAMIGELKDHVGAFKIGLQLFSAAGPDLVREVVDAGAKVFLDLKFHDIPNTVARAAREVAKLGVWMFNIHASGGAEMMLRTVEEVADACSALSAPRPHVIAVTVLTSSNEDTLAEIGVSGPVDSQVLKLAALASNCGMDGIVASPHEVKLVRENIADKDFLIVTPGIRPAFATNNDQKRVMTPGEAVSAGADHLVIGRPILHAPDRIAAIEKILGEI